MNARTLLTVAGASLLLAGCSLPSKNASPNSTATPIPTPVFQDEEATLSSPSPMVSNSYKLDGTTGNTAPSASPASTGKDDTDSMQKDLDGLKIESDFDAMVE